MKNLRRALAFSAAVLLLAGCPRKGVEPPERADASPGASPQGASVGSAAQALQDGGAPQAAATGGPDGGVAFEPTAAAGAEAGSQPQAKSTTADAGVRGASGAAVQGPSRSADAGGSAPGRESCVDRWLAARQLDRYGHKQGTMYAGGTPLFDERTGERTDRLEYIFARHPAAKQACPQ